MKRKSLIILSILTFLVFSLAIIYIIKNEEPKFIQVSLSPIERKFKNKYLSITYTTKDETVDSTRMMNFYVYDFDTNKLENKAQIEYRAQYALGAVDLYNNKIYYTRREVMERGYPDYLYEYDLSTKISKQLDNENVVDNFIYPLKDRLLVQVSHNSLNPAIFNLDTNKFSYLYDKKGVDEKKFCSRPVPLNYNHEFKQFINVYNDSKESRTDDFMTGKKPIDYYISLVDLNLNTIFTYAKPTIAFEDIYNGVQLTKNQILIVSRDALNEYKPTFYIIDYTKQTCTEIPNPMPLMISFGTFTTVDGGKTFIVRGRNEKNEPGIYFYDCINNTTTPIILDDPEAEAHVVDFFLLEK